MKKNKRKKGKDNKLQWLHIHVLIKTMIEVEGGGWNGTVMEVEGGGWNGIGSSREEELTKN